MTKIVKKRLSDSRIAAGRKRRLEKLSRRPDNEIDTSDIPELTEKFWQTRSAILLPAFEAAAHSSH